MRKILVSSDKDVFKIIHNDNSETAIKTVSSCDTHIKEDGSFILNETDRNKYSIFISNSTGCFMKCKFCYLTLKEMEYNKINTDNTYSNILEAIQERVVYNILRPNYKNKELPDIHTKYVKLCWMGMGDAFVDSKKVKTVSYNILKTIMRKNYAIGLDGVDLSTVIPNVKNINKIFSDFKELENILSKFPLNPHNNIIVHRNKKLSNIDKEYPKRSRFRLFYSLHSAIQKTRNYLIPNAMPLNEAIPALIEYSENNKYNIIFHHMFIDGFNDTNEEINALIDLIEKYNLQKYELRILRYNTCEVSTYIHESSKFNNIIKQLVKIHPHIKVQISAGSEIKAACGQFLINI